ncbi:hypothetical protein OEZ85_000697 [Tetradesmus obliquus]|uniref:Uncharacterized protein n=1 Tax=Tetradesmus obliquus TaxID=3088 RepID=A0ABY8UIY1_TETOB|nr:hypothetical protein OEZ85_000697 [Tetradesmus obliquus]
MTGLPAEEETIAAVTLGHITGLTELRCERYMLEGTTFDLQPGDMVPRSLRRLTLSSVESIQQLADLSALETLELC